MLDAWRMEGWKDGRMEGMWTSLIRFHYITIRYKPHHTTPHHTTPHRPFIYFPILQKTMNSCNALSVASIPVFVAESNHFSLKEIGFRNRRRHAASASVKVDCKTNIPPSWKAPPMSLFPCCVSLDSVVTVILLVDCCDDAFNSSMADCRSLSSWQTSQIELDISAPDIVMAKALPS